VPWGTKTLYSQTTPSPSTKGGEKEKVRLIMEKVKVEGRTQRPQAEEAKVKEQATDLKKEEEKVGIGTKTRASPKRPRVHPNVVPPITPKKVHFRGKKRFFFLFLIA
jgi:hypothetical protein